MLCPTRIISRCSRSEGLGVPVARILLMSRGIDCLLILWVVPNRKVSGLCIADSVII